MYAAGATALAMMLVGCGQKGPLFIPQTPAAAQRATLPQTIFGGDKAPATTTDPADTPPVDTDQPQPDESGTRR